MVTVPQLTALERAALLFAIALGIAFAWLAFGAQSRSPVAAIVLARFAARHANPFLLLGLFMAFAAGLGFGLHHIKRRSPFLYGLAEILFGLVGAALGVSSFFRSVDTTPTPAAANPALVVSAVACLTAIYVVVRGCDAIASSIHRPHAAAATTAPACTTRPATPSPSPGVTTLADVAQAASLLSLQLTTLTDVDASKAHAKAVTSASHATSVADQAAEHSRACQDVAAGWSQVKDAQAAAYRLAKKAARL